MMGDRLQLLSWYSELCFEPLDGIKKIFGTVGKRSYESQRGKPTYVWSSILSRLGSNGDTRLRATEQMGILLQNLEE